MAMMMHVEGRDGVDSVKRNGLVVLHWLWLNIWYQTVLDGGYWKKREK